MLRNSQQAQRYDASLEIHSTNPYSFFVAERQEFKKTLGGSAPGRYAAQLPGRVSLNKAGCRASAHVKTQEFFLKFSMTFLHYFSVLERKKKVTEEGII